MRLYVVAPKGKRIRWPGVVGEFPDSRNSVFSPDRFWFFPTKADAVLALAQSGSPEKNEVFRVEVDLARAPERRVTWPS